ncbi:diguanylate cyclase (GGDEF) domain-containing protein [Modicisalibacter ilicicola DSM 19980]|uniref:diguanylate cyclase n=1 Tax=Modicisalibacter ilicicola DSM 19980 TaxID=1121942 RepID=A0A1M4ZAJ3_9GAMM|nr:diguanylate cyclase [Halomonas ilicicola]SHF15005.1 diguanylate cyclase (GGDEF) domain-containing protein [Halomonas ilicicola DSM 19980]
MALIFDSLRYRFFLAMSVLLLVAVTSLVLIAHHLAIPALLAEEEVYATAELDRAMRAIGNELGHLSLLNKDWAIWDDSYAFLTGEAGDYLESNVADGLVFEDADLSLLVFLETDGSPHWIAGIDPANQRYTSCPGPTEACTWTAPVLESLQGRIANGLSDETRLWLHAHPQPGLVSVWPIVRSNGAGPAVGWLLMMRPMDTAWLGRVREGFGLALAVEAIASDAPAPRQEIAREGSQTLIALRRVPAAPPGHALELRVELPRHAFRARLDDLRLTLYWVVGLVVLVVVLVLLERMILSPLRQLATFTQHVQQRGDIDPPRSLLQRRDEIGVLARKFQQLLERQRCQTSSLIELSQHDALTGLGNRRLFDHRLEEAIDIANLSGRSVVRLMVDIDHFKAYNDRYGHPAGDKCLKTVAAAMGQHFSLPQQLVARTGGEEFMIILPDTSLEAGSRQAETLRRAIEALALPHAASTASSVITISIGVARYFPGQARDIEGLTRAVDDALYAAKQGGRNRVRREAG